MSQNQIENGFVVRGQDGSTHVFDTKKEAEDFLRKPLVIAALMALTSGNQELADWLYATREEIEDSFESDKIRRVTKQEAKKLEAALERIKVALADDKEAAFVVQHSEHIKDSFRWPKVARLSAEEATKQIRGRLEKIATNGDEVNHDLVSWLEAQKEQLVAAFATGIQKREVNEKAAAGLAAYQAKKKAEANIKYVAAKWNVPVETLVAEDNLVKHADGRTYSYEQIAQEKEAEKQSKAQ